MSLFIEQTPTIRSTPSVVMYNLPSHAFDKGGYQISNMLRAIKSNSIVKPDKGEPLSKTIAKIEDLCSRGENWGGCSSDAPNPDAIARSKGWISDMYRDNQILGLEWLDPHVSTNEFGDVSFEWWKGSRKLTVYVSACDTLLLQVWGPSIQNEMSEATADTSAERQSAWQWLMS